MNGFYQASLGVGGTTFYRINSQQTPLNFPFTISTEHKNPFQLGNTLWLIENRANRGIYSDNYTWVAFDFDGTAWTRNETKNLDLSRFGISVEDVVTTFSIGNTVWIGLNIAGIGVENKMRAFDFDGTAWTANSAKDLTFVDNQPTGGGL